MSHAPMALMQAPEQRVGVELVSARGAALARTLATGAQGEGRGL